MKKTTAESFDEFNKAIYQFFLLFWRTFGIEKFTIWLNNKLNKRK